MTDREAMKMALEALRYASAVAQRQLTTKTKQDYSLDLMNKSMAALEAELAQPEQEPVAWMCENAVGYKYFRWKKPPNHFKSTPLYTAPPSKQWVGLTEQEKETIVDQHTSDDAGYDIFCDGHGVVRAVETLLKEKNT